jgi:hypothetical protein
MTPEQQVSLTLEQRRQLFADVEHGTAIAIQRKPPTILLPTESGAEELAGTFLGLTENDEVRLQQENGALVLVELMELTNLALKETPEQTARRSIRHSLQLIVNADDLVLIAAQTMYALEMAAEERRTENWELELTDAAASGFAMLDDEDIEGYKQDARFLLKTLEQSLKQTPPLEVEGEEDAEHSS